MVAESPRSCESAHSGPSPAVPQRKSSRPSRPRALGARSAAGFAIRFARLGLAGALLAPRGASAQAPSAPAVERPDVVLVTIDTLRPDALGWVAGRTATPRIDALAAAGARARDVVSPVPLTMPAHASLLTALDPPRHGSHRNGQSVATNLPGVASTFATAGYRTGAFVSAFPLARRFGLDAGFQVYDDHLPGDAGAANERACTATNAATVAWLAAAPPPRFVWVHYYEPHAPYEPAARESPAARAPTDAAADYRAEVERADACLGALLDAWPTAAAGRVVVVVGDHGESLGEHGERTHGTFVYDATVLVPLVIHAPTHVAAGALPPGIRLVDVAPTLLDRLGLPALTGADGVSFAERLPAPAAAARAGGVAAAWSARPAWIESELSYGLYGWAPLRGIRHGGFKLIAAPRPELYDLVGDPGERVNRYEAEPDRAAALLATFEAVRARTTGGLAPAAAVERGPAVVDAQAVERLRALGYLDAGTSGPAPADVRGRADPKDRLAVREQLEAASEGLDAGRAGEALARFEAVLLEEPRNPFALQRSAAALAQLGRVDEAIARFERAIEVAPENGETRRLLAETLVAIGRNAAAEAAWRALAEREPRRAEAWAGLAVACARQGDYASAATALERAAALEPERAIHVNRLADVERRRGRLDAAIASLERAAALEGGAFTRAGELGTWLVTAGRSTEGRRWLERVAPSEPGYGAARLDLALLASAAGDESGARAEVERALAAQPELAERVRSDPRLAPYVPVPFAP